MTKLQITKTYLLDLVSQGLLKSEIHSRIITDFELDNKAWKIGDTTKLFKCANISLRAKPRVKKPQFEIID